MRDVIAQEKFLFCYRYIASYGKIMFNRRVMITRLKHQKEDSYYSVFSIFGMRDVVFRYLAEPSHGRVFSNSFVIDSLEGDFNYQTYHIVAISSIEKFVADPFLHLNYFYKEIKDKKFIRTIKT